MNASTGILLTGASSFFGRMLFDALAGTGADVVATYRHEPLGGVPDPRWRSLDIAQAEQFGSLPGTVETVIHAAAVSSDGQVPVADLAAANVEGTRNVIDYAIRAEAKRFLFLSSMLTYGQVAADEVTSETPMCSPGAYGLSKRLGEMMLAERADVLPSVSLRAPGILGPGAERHWLATVLDHVRRHEDVTIYNADGPFNNAVAGTDLAAFLVRLSGMALKGAAAFPLASAGITTIRRAASLIIELTRSRSRLVEAAAPRRAYTVNNREALQLGFRPMDIEAAIRAYAKT